MSRQTRERWELLASRGLVEGSAPAEGEEEEGLPIQMMMGFSAWVATLCMLSGASCCVVSVMEDVFEAGAIVVPGAALIGLSWAIYFLTQRQPELATGWMAQFTRQLALSWSLTGQALVLMGITLLFKLRGEADAALLLGGVGLLMQCGLIALIDDATHRTWSGLLGVLALSVFMWGAGALGFTTSLVLAAWLALYWAEPRLLSRHSSHVVPVRRGLLLGLVIPLVWGVAWRVSASPHVEVSRWAGEGAVVVVGLAALWRWRPHAGEKPAWVMIVAGLLAPLAVFAPGLTASLMMLAAGFERRERGTMILGLMALLCSLSSYYYMLALTLQAKSLILIGLGVILMGAWRWMARGEEVSDA